MAMADRIAVMNEGHIEQLAVPSELYDAPATPFVADFIGDMSQVTGTLAGDDVALPGGGRISIGRRLVEASNGTEVTVGLRPEGAVLRANGSADVQASVVTAMVLGDRLQLVVRLDDDQELLIRQGRSPEDGDLATLEPGDSVGVQFRPRAGLLMGVGARTRTATDAEELEPTLRGAAT
jgi:ABC-type Fe3+/spermidine/putrescine transport system ATPase subunit